VTQPQEKPGPPATRADPFFPQPVATAEGKDSSGGCGARLSSKRSAGAGIQDERSVLFFKSAGFQGERRERASASLLPKGGARPVVALRSVRPCSSALPSTLHRSADK
jgi:hypothetical protein